MEIDDGSAIHYTAVPEGTPVYANDGTRVGKVSQIVDNYREHIFDGVVVELSDGEFVFVDGPEVARTAERGVTLSISPREAARLPPPDPGVGTFKPRHGRLGKIASIFGGGWKRDR